MDVHLVLGTQRLLDLKGRLEGLLKENMTNVPCIKDNLELYNTVNLRPVTRINLIQTNWGGVPISISV